MGISENPGHESQVDTVLQEEGDCAESYLGVKEEEDCKVFLEFGNMWVTGELSKKCIHGQETHPCIGTWNVRSMNQGKLEVVRQELVRVSIDILGISELKWTWRGEFTSDDHYIYYCGQESLRRNGVVIIVNKRVWNAVLGYNLKTTESSLFVSKKNHSVTW